MPYEETKILNTVFQRGGILSLLLNVGSKEFFLEHSYPMLTDIMILLSPESYLIHPNRIRSKPNESAIPLSWKIN